MPRLIILEGVDSTGKSSLSKFLAKELNACYFHAAGHKTLHYSMNALHMSMLHDIAVNLENGHNVVCDRHWPSEVAYGSVLRSEAFKMYRLSEMVDRVSELKPIYIHCHSDNGWERYEETHKNHDRQQFHHLTHTEYAAIAWKYVSIFEKIKHIPYSIEEHGMRQHQIVEQIHEH